MKNKNIVQSFNCALQGVVQAIKRERNLKIHLAAQILVLVMCFIFRVSLIEFIIVLIISCVVIVAELINTSIEAVIDLICEERYDPLAKMAKDVAAGAVFITAITAAIIGICIFYDDIDGVFKHKLDYVRLLPIELAIMSLLVVLLTIIIIKVKRGAEYSVFSGGFPSGHSAIAFAAATIVLFLSSSSAVILLGYFLAFLVGQSRYESKIHSFYEVLAGSVVGVLSIVIIYKLFML